MEAAVFLRDSLTETRGLWFVVYVPLGVASKGADPSCHIV